MARITTYFKQTIGSNPLANALLARIRKSYPDLQHLEIENVYRIESSTAEKKIAKLKGLFCYPGAETIGKSTKLFSKDAPIIEVGYKRAWTDNELKSILHSAQARKIKGIEWVRVAHRFQLYGVDEATAQKIAEDFLYNPQTQEIIQPNEVWTTLKPQGEYQGVEEIDFAGLSVEQLEQISIERRWFLSIPQIEVLKKQYVSLKRQARDAEIEFIAAVFFGDHCAHITWQALGLLPKLMAATAKINHPLVLSCFEDNAGVMKFYGGWALAHKGETHISPSMLDPYGGIMTMHGGVERDPMETGLGAYPFAGTLIMGTRDLRLPANKVHPGTFHPRYTMSEAIRATRDQTNPMGIAMSVVDFVKHDRYAKIFALGHSVAILPAKFAKKGTPNEGDYIVLVGGLTGRDGIHGATVSSAETTSETKVLDAAHVQIDDPIEQITMKEMMAVIRDAGCNSADTDCGAAGLGSAAGEMGKKILAKNGLTSSGAWVNLAWVQLKCAAMRPWEILISESQDRDVLAIKPEKLAEFLQLSDEYGVPATVIGIFTSTQHFQAIFDPSLDNKSWIANPTIELSGEIAVDQPYSFLNQTPPLPKYTLVKPERNLKPYVPATPTNETAWTELMVKLLGHYNISDTSPAIHNFDQTVGGYTKIALLIGKDDNIKEDITAFTPVRGKNWAAVIANAINPYYGEISPSGMGQLLYSRALAKLVAAGVAPWNITCGANVYSPPAEKPENAWDLNDMVVHGYVPASIAYGAPVIVGKDSSQARYVYKQDGKMVYYVDAPITLDIFALGRCIDYRKLVPKAFANPGDKLYLYTPGLRSFDLGGSLLLDLFHERGDSLPVYDLVETHRGFMRYHKLLRANGYSQNIHSRSVVSDGGLIKSVFEMSMASGMGCELDLPLFNRQSSLALLAGEFNAGILFATSLSDDAIKKHLKGEFFRVGTVIDQPLIQASHGGSKLFKASTEELAYQWKKTFAEVM